MCFHISAYINYNGEAAAADVLGVRDFLSNKFLAFFAFVIAKILHICTTIGLKIDI